MKKKEKRKKRRRKEKKEEERKRKRKTEDDKRTWKRGIKKEKERVEQGRWTQQLIWYRCVHFFEILIFDQVVFVNVVFLLFFFLKNVKYQECASFILYYNNDIYRNNDISLILRQKKIIRVSLKIEHIRANIKIMVIWNYTCISFNILFQFSIKRCNRLRSCWTRVL